MSETIDVVEVARAALASERGPSQVSINETKAMALAIIRIEIERQTSPDVHNVHALVDRALAAFREFEQSRHTARERANRKAFEQALKAIADHFQLEIINDQH